MAAGKKTGGRQKGTKNKHKAVAELMGDVVVQSAMSGETPLEYMLRIMRDANQEDARRDNMARAAAPYVHARLAATEVNDKPKVEVDPSKSSAEIRQEMIAWMASRGMIKVVEELKPKRAVSAPALLTHRTTGSFR
jgi:hypothetical protein